MVTGDELPNAQLNRRDEQKKVCLKDERSIYLHPEIHLGSPHPVEADVRGRSLALQQTLFVSTLYFFTLTEINPRNHSCVANTTLREVNLCYLTPFINSMKLFVLAREDDHRWYLDACGKLKTLILFEPNSPSMI